MTGDTSGIDLVRWICGIMAAYDSKPIACQLSASDCGFACELCHRKCHEQQRREREDVEEQQVQEHWEAAPGFKDDEVDLKWDTVSLPAEKQADGSWDFAETCSEASHRSWEVVQPVRALEIPGEIMQVEDLKSAPPFYVREYFERDGYLPTDRRTFFPPSTGADVEPASPSTSYALDSRSTTVFV